MTSTFSLRFMAVLFAGISLLSSCQKEVVSPDTLDLEAGANNGKTQTIAQIVNQNPDFKLLKLALAQTDLLGAVNAKGANLTVFAPPNSAFEQIGLGSASAISKFIEVNGVDALRSVLLYHVLGIKAVASTVVAGGNNAYETLNGKQVYVNVSGMKPCINGAGIIATDVPASNGVIHVIDKVIFPPTKTIAEIAVENGFTTLVAAVTHAGLLGAVTSPGKYTVFAPTNQAFATIGFDDASDFTAGNQALVTSVVKYHVLASPVMACGLFNGNVESILGATPTLTINANPATVKGKSNSIASNIIAADFYATNGIVHVINQVLLP